MASLRTRNKKRKAEDTPKEEPSHGIIDMMEADAMSNISKLSSSSPKDVVFSGRSGSSQHVLYDGSRCRMLLEGRISSVNWGSSRATVLLALNDISYENARVLLTAAALDLHGALSSWTEEQRESYYGRTLYVSQAGNKFLRLQIPLGKYKSGDKKGRSICNFSSKVEEITAINHLQAHAQVTTVCRCEVWNDHELGKRDGFKNGRPSTKYIVTHLRVNSIAEADTNATDVDESIDALLLLARGKLHHLRE